MRYPGPTKVPGDKSTESYQEGPKVVPGSYGVRLSAGGQNREASFQIVEDPRVAATQQDLQAQFDLLLQIRDKLSRTHEAINTIRNLSSQAGEWQRRVKGQTNEQQIVDAAKALSGKLTAIEKVLIQPKAEDPRQLPPGLNEKLAALTVFVDADDARPTQQAKEAFAELSTQIDAQLDALQQVVQTDLPAFDRLIREAGVPALVPSAEPVKR